MTRKLRNHKITPTIENINALPEPLRKWVHDLETRCDPAGDLRARVLAEERAETAERDRDLFKRKYETASDQLVAMTGERNRMESERDALQQWVHDLQAGMFINCVYCGHRYGPGDEVPATMAEALKEHIEQCQKHPMSALNERLRNLEAALVTARQACKLAIKQANAVLEDSKDVPK